MSKGENIFKRKDGRWEARYIKGYELSGKIRYGFCYGRTYKEAKEKVTRCKAALLTGSPVQRQGGTTRFAAYCDQWLLTVKGGLKESTVAKYAAILDKHIKPVLGACFPADITSALIGQFRDRLLSEDGLSPKTVKDILVVLRSVLKFTEQQLPNVLSQIEIAYPKANKKEMRVLSREEQQRLVEYLMDGMDECRFGILLALFTGMRIGELCALKWNSISLEEHTVRITSTMQRLQNLNAGAKSRTRIAIGAPKSDMSLRTIPLTEQAACLCARMAPEDRSAYVLTGTDRYMEPRTLQYRLGKYTAACGLEGVHFHTLRHTFATRCVEVGFDLKSLSEILGHASTSITLDRYVHASMDFKRDNMNKLSSVGL